MKKRLTKQERAELNKITNNRMWAWEDAAKKVLTDAGYRISYAKWRDSYHIVNSEGSNGGVGFEYLESAVRHFLPGQYHRIKDEIDTLHPLP